MAIVRRMLMDVLVVVGGLIFTLEFTPNPVNIAKSLGASCETQSTIFHVYIPLESIYIGLRHEARKIIYRTSELDSRELYFVENLLHGNEIVRECYEEKRHKSPYEEMV